MYRIQTCFSKIKYKIAKVGHPIKLGKHPTKEINYKIGACR